MKNILSIYFILLLISCMPEEDLPLKEQKDSEEYFIECYCKPGEVFALSATTLLPFSENISANFVKDMKVKIKMAEKEIELSYIVFKLPDIDFVYNYGNAEIFSPEQADTLYLDIQTKEGKTISGKTSVPSQISIYNCHLNNDQAVVQFYLSGKPEENYYIYIVELLNGKKVVGKESAYLDYSETGHSFIETSLAIPTSVHAEQLRITLKRLTKDNYDYQLSLNAANSAQQSSITTPVSLDGNLNGALGIFSCYTVDERLISIE